MPRWILAAPLRALLGAALVVAFAGAGACSGGPPTEAEAQAELAKQIVGTWRLVPPDADLRRLRIIDAALAGRPDRKQALGALSTAEATLFDTWSRKKGAEVADMRAQLRFVDGAEITFVDDQVSLRFGTNRFGPVDYEVLDAGEGEVRVRFDPRLGNGAETHEIELSSPNAGIDRVVSEKRGAFTPMRLTRL